MAAVDCRRRPSRRRADEAAICEDPDRVSRRAAGTQDGAAIAKLFAPDGVEMPPNAPAAKGRAAIEAFHKAFGQQFSVALAWDHHDTELKGLHGGDSGPRRRPPTSRALMANDGRRADRRTPAKVRSSC
jgi:hypothetical protein